MAKNMRMEYFLLAAAALTCLFSYAWAKENKIRRKLKEQEREQPKSPIDTDFDLL
jgi:hypothetical protein